MDIPSCACSFHYILRSHRRNAHVKSTAASNSHNCAYDHYAHFIAQMTETCKQCAYGGMAIFFGLLPIHALVTQMMKWICAFHWIRKCILWSQMSSTDLKRMSTVSVRNCNKYDMGRIPELRTLNLKITAWKWKLVTTGHTSWRIGQQQSSSTPFCHWPASGRCPSCGSSSFPRPQFFARLFSVDLASAFPLGSSGLAWKLLLYISFFVLHLHLQFFLYTVRISVCVGGGGANK